MSHEVGEETTQVDEEVHVMNCTERITRGSMGTSGKRDIAHKGSTVHNTIEAEHIP